MNKTNLDKIIEQSKEALSQVKSGDFTIYFYLYNTGGVPKGGEGYIYDMALTLKEDGYNVKLLYFDDKNEFIHGSEWLGDKYKSLEAINSYEKITMKPTDFVVIPELYSNVMNATTPNINEQGKFTGISSQRVVLAQNVGYITDIIPMGRQWGDYKIRNVITNSNMISNKVKDFFPYVNIKTIYPGVSDIFEKPLKPKDLTITIVADEDSKISRVVKQFMWKNPLFKWFTFKNIRNLSREEFADEVKKSAILVWEDVDTNFGYVALEAMKAGTVVVGRVPDNLPDWMSEDDNLSNCGVWVQNTDEIADALSGVVTAIISDKMPEDYIKSMKEVSDKYSMSNFKKNTIDTWKELIGEYEAELEGLIAETEKKKADVEKIKNQKQ